MKTIPVRGGSSQILYRDNKGAHGYFAICEHCPDGYYRLCSCTQALKSVNKPGLVYWAANMATDYLQAVWKERELVGTDFELARKMHRAKADAAADAGSDLHDYIEEYTRSRIEKTAMPEPSRNIRAAVATWLGWVAAYKVQFVAAERVVVSEIGAALTDPEGHGHKWGSAGRLDSLLVASVNNKLSLVDWKGDDLTKKDGQQIIYFENRLQTAFYAANVLYDMAVWVPPPGFVFSVLPEGLKLERCIVRIDRLGREPVRFEWIKTTIEEDLDCFKAALRLSWGMSDGERSR